MFSFLLAETMKRCMIEGPTYRYQPCHCGALSEESPWVMTTVGTSGCLSQESHTLEKSHTGRRQLGSQGMTEDWDRPKPT